MGKEITGSLVLFALIVATQSLPALNYGLLDKTALSPAPAIARNKVDRFTLGASVPGSMPIYTTKSSVNYDTVQPEVRVTIAYPADDANSPSGEANDEVITQVDVFLSGSDSLESQAYVVSGGIGERTISLELTAQNTSQLQYTVIIYGQTV